VGEGVINHDPLGAQHTFFADGLAVAANKGEMASVNALRHFGTTERVCTLLPGL
jgi:hypothetical protein